jgi:hypothetical protein
VEEAFLQNRMVRALCPERARLLRDMQLASLKLGEVIYEPDSRLDYVYLPTTSVVSSIYTTQEGATAQIALIFQVCASGLLSRSTLSSIKRYLS